MSCAVLRQKHEEVLWRPNPRQAEFLACSDDEVLYGGAAGGGKSDALLIDALGLQQDALRWEGYKAILFRRTYPELQELIERSQGIYRHFGGQFNVSNHAWRFPSGAKILFSYMDSDSDKYRYQSFQFQWIGWDELTHWPRPDCFDYMITRLRSTNPAIRCYVRAATNPGGPGHTWVKRRWGIGNDGAATAFIDSIDVGGEMVVVSRAFVPARLSDNPYLSATPDYRKRLLARNERDRKLLLDGRWDVFDGQFFSDWDPAVHVIKPFVIPDHWPRWRAMDWGRKKPYAIGWFTIDPDGVIYLYRELYGCGGQPDEGTGEDAGDVKRRLIDIEREEIEAGIEFRNNPADPSIWIKSGTGKSIAECFGRVDPPKTEYDRKEVRWTSPFAFKSGDGQNLKLRVNGWHECVKRLRDGTFKVFDTCKHFIRTVPELPVDPANSEDLDSSAEDHAADMWRYSLVSRHRPAQHKKAQLPRRGFTFDQIASDTAPKRSFYRM